MGAQAEIQAFAKQQGIPLIMPDVAHGYESKRPQKQLETKVENEGIPEHDHAKKIASGNVEPVKSKPAEYTSKDFASDIKKAVDERAARRATKIAKVENEGIPEHDHVKKIASGNVKPVKSKPAEYTSKDFASDIKKAADERAARRATKKATDERAASIETKIASENVEPERSISADFRSKNLAEQLNVAKANLSRREVSSDIHSSGPRLQLSSPGSLTNKRNAEDNSRSTVRAQQRRPSAGGG